MKFLENVLFVQFNKTLLINDIFMIFVSGVTCYYGWDNVCSTFRVQLFLQAAEMKLVSINRYRFIFVKLKSFFS